MNIATLRSAADPSRQYPPICSMRPRRHVRWCINCLVRRSSERCRRCCASKPLWDDSGQNIFSTWGPHERVNEQIFAVSAVTLVGLVDYLRSRLCGFGRCEGRKWASAEGNATSTMGYIGWPGIRCRTGTQQYCRKEGSKIFGSANNRTASTQGA
jgi:hypothetical protein